MDRRAGHKKSPAEAKVSGCQPAHWISVSSDSRTEGSLSAMNTVGVVVGMDGSLASW
jgi:hypothetical protein